jgi:hypothetical protein
LSSELKIILSKVAAEDIERKEIEFEEGIDRYKSLLLRVAEVKPFDMLISSQGTEQSDIKQKQTVLDLAMLERAQLVKGQTKETDHNIYRQYELTPKGAELVEKFSKQTISVKENHQPHTLGAASSQETPIRGAQPNQVPCPVCGRTFKIRAEMERHKDATHHETKGHD